jgi:hypothetical protein
MWAEGERIKESEAAGAGAGGRGNARIGEEKSEKGEAGGGDLCDEWGSGGTLFKAKGQHAASAFPLLGSGDLCLGQQRGQLDGWTGGRS